MSKLKAHWILEENVAYGKEITAETLKRSSIFCRNTREAGGWDRKAWKASQPNLRKRRTLILCRRHLLSRAAQRLWNYGKKKSFPISMLENVCKGTVGEGCVQTWQLKTKTGEGVGAESSVHVPFQTGLHKPQFQSCFPCLGTANKWITFFIICCSSECFPNVLLAMQL